jgi:ABC-type nitrate/sulfonate/bicarbonate transport system substrate-binding protein
MRQRARTTALLLSPLLLATAVLAACGDDDEDDAGGATSPGTAPATTSADTAADTSAGTTAPPASGDVVAGAAFPAARCEANRAAGTITYLTGYDYAAAGSIVEVIVAEAEGYYDAMCLDVEIVSSFSTANYPIIASGDAQFASGGSFSEVIRYAAANEAPLVAVTVAGRTPIDALIVKDGEATTLADLQGTTIGVKNALPAGVEAMLAGAGLEEGTHYQTVLVDGFDPTQHIALPGIVGFPGWKSNEPGILERAGIPFELFDPSAEGVPGSFGAIFTTKDFVDEHPTAAEDFVRATLHGLATAIADPAAAAAAAIELAESGGNPSLLSPESEAFRWQTESELISSMTPAGTAAGVPDMDALTTEVETYAALGYFGEGVTPDVAAHVADLSAAVVDHGEIVWPS